MDIEPARSPGMAGRWSPPLEGHDGHSVFGPVSLELADFGAPPCRPVAACAGCTCYCRAASTPVEQSVLTFPECA